MARYKVTDPNGIPYGGGTLKKGDTFTHHSHDARVRAWLRFGQIEAAPDPKKAPEAAPDPKTK